MERNWIFSSNTFEVQTRTSFKKMLTLTLDHMAKITGTAVTNLEFEPIRDSYIPLHEAYTAAYAAWKGSEGTHEGSTLNVEEIFQQLNTQLRIWEAQVRVVFPEDSPNERSIFPDKRVPFQSGTYEQRISAVKTLYEKLATFTTQPSLVTLSVTVSNFYNTIEEARFTQSTNEVGISSRSSTLEAARLACAVGMYGNLGRIMFIFRATPVDIEQFWDMSLLRNTSDNTYSQNLSVDSGTTATVGLSVAQRNAIDANTNIKITNTSSAPVPLKVGFSTTAGEEPTATITVEPEMMRELSASELGWSSEKRFLCIRNESAETGTATVQVDL